MASANDGLPGVPDEDDLHDDLDEADYWLGVRDACQGLLAQIEFLDDAALTAVHLGLMDPQLELEACALSQVLLATRPSLVRLRDRAAKEGE